MFVCLMCLGESDCVEYNSTNKRFVSRANWLPKATRGTDAQSNATQRLAGQNSYTGSQQACCYQ